MVFGMEHADVFARLPVMTTAARGSNENR
jgi:hypothetical protein